MTSRKRLVPTMRTCVVFAVGLAALGFAQAPDVQWRDRGDRFEGTGFKTDVANPRLDLRGFVVSPGTVPKAPVLELFFYPWVASPISVWAQERRERDNYRMEPKTPPAGWKANSWNAFCAWRSDVLDQAGLTPSDLGVVVRLDNEHPRSGRVAPVVLKARGQPMSALVTEYEATFRLGMSPSRVSYAVMAGCKSFTRLAGDFAGIKNTGDVFSIRFTLPPDRREETSLVVTARPLDKTPEDERHYCFVPPPAAPEPLCPAK